MPKDATGTLFGGAIQGKSADGRAQHVILVRQCPDRVPIRPCLDIWSVYFDHICSKIQCGVEIIDAFLGQYSMTYCKIKMDSSIRGEKKISLTDNSVRANRGEMGQLLRTLMHHQY
jgi:hypothetical protein